MFASRGAEQPDTRGRAWFVCLSLVLALGAGACAGQGPDWPANRDPLAASSGSVEEPQLPVEDGLARLRRAVDEGTVSLADAYRYRLAQLVDLELGVDVPADYTVADLDLETDLVLDELAADLPSMSAADQAALGIWTVPWYYPGHPMSLQRARQLAAAQPEPAALAGLALAGLQPRMPRPPGRPATNRSSAGTQFCPQDTLINPIYRPTDRITNFDGVEEEWADPDDWWEQPIDYCWRKVNDHIVLSWPSDVMGGPSVSGVQAIVDQLIPRINESFERYLDIFQTMPSEFIYRHDEESIVMGIFGQTGRAFAHSASGRSYIYLPLLANLGYLRDYVVPHELFHAFQQQLRDAAPAAPKHWILEGMANWGAKQVVGSAQAGSYNYHNTMEKLLSEVAGGADSSSYPVHLLWQDVERRQGQNKVRGMILLHQAFGSNQDVVNSLDPRNNWHTFAKSLFHRDPWKSLQDNPEDFPESWQIGITGPLFIIGTADYEMYELEMPRLSAKRSTVTFGTSSPGYVQLRLQYPEGSEGEGLEYSAVLPNQKKEVALTVGETEIICFDASDPLCEEETVYSPEQRVELIVSNWDYSQPSRSAELHVSTIPIRMRVSKIKVGDTESEITGDLQFERTEDDKIEFTATDMWFEFDDEVYARMIPDGSTSERVNVSEDLIRDYVKDNAVFRGRQELTFQFNEDAQPRREDGKWWIELQTERHEGADFFATPHRFFVKLDPEWFEAMGGGSGVMGPGGIVLQRVIYQLNRTEFPEASFAQTLEDWFRAAMTLGTEADSQGKPSYSVDPNTGELLFRVGNVTLTLVPY